MKAIILAAGYATRLYPLTKDMPKALLPIGGKPIIDYILESLARIPELTGVYVVTNHKFAGHFERWACDHAHSKWPVQVLDDGTSTEETRRGAIGDIQFVLEQTAIDEDLIIIAGDNFFTYRLSDYVAFYRQIQKDCVCVKRIADINALKQFGVAVLDQNNILVDVEEKPPQPKSHMAIFATYIYKRETLPLFAQYLAEGNKPDAPGYFVQWLHRQKEVAAYVFTEDCYDIGTPEAYQEVQALFPEGKTSE